MYSLLLSGVLGSVVVKDLMSKDKDKDLKICPRGSSRTRTFLEDNNTGFGHGESVT